ncbi:uncharacterized protein LOC117593913 [Esox lucius]|uniref:EGF-like domain-containing protein n=1 Tax=Esox lucius TaxID=8010 RepID=A0AAY5KGK5_ESOLU|nr:uncharacterized protein LOC117593913 [Esox lucius]
MSTKKLLILVVYLLLHICFSQASPVLECDGIQKSCMNEDAASITGKNSEETAIDHAVKMKNALEDFKSFGEGLEQLNTILKDTEKVSKTLTKVLKVMDSLSKVASCFGFVGSILGLILAFIPQSDPNMEFMKEQFSEINRKLDSIALQIDSLAKEIEWDTYASTYGRDENAIKNSWAELMKFLEQAQAPALDERRKASLAEAFTIHYTNSATRNSVSNFYRYLTENEAASLNKNLLQLVLQKSKGDVKILSKYSGYFLSLMVKGLQLNVYYDIMKGYGGVSGAKEGVERLTTMLTAMKEAMIQCADGTLNWALEDANKIATEQFSSNLELANAISTKLNQKFIWYEWTVIVHGTDNKEEKVFGYSTDLVAQNKAKIHIIHREKNFKVNEGIKEEIKRELGESLCRKMENSGLDSPFADRTLKHLEYIHTVNKDSSYAQTPTRGLIEFECKKTVPTQYTTISLKMFDLTIFLKSNDVVEQDPCSKNKCHNDGKCKQLKDTTEELCICTRMFTGPTCKESVEHFIDFSAIEAQLTGIALKPVPDMTAIYYSIKDLQSYARIQVQTLRNDIAWTVIFVKYFDVIEKFRYIKDKLFELQAENVTQSHFTAEVGGTFTKGTTFLYMLSKFNKMMQGKGFGETRTILDIVRETLLIDSNENNPKECTLEYSDKLDYFVHYIFALEKEAVSAWSNYLVITGQKDDVNIVKETFKRYVSEQWALYNKIGCGPLNAEKLSNSYCKKPYHSIKQMVHLKCEDGYKPFPKTVTCSNGQWSHLPVCHTDQIEKLTLECKYEKGTTVCTASCMNGWTFPDGSVIVNYKCSDQPCKALDLARCDRCSIDRVCQDSKVCREGKCISACNDNPCGINAVCTGANHAPKCTCRSPWVGNPYQGCREKDLRWETSSEIPSNAVKSPTGTVVCRGRAPDDRYHGGWIYVTGGQTCCNFEYDLREHSVRDYQVLVDPCAGSGVEWVTGGPNSKSVKIGASARYPDVMTFVCNDRNGITGKVFLTRNGWRCHIGFGNQAWLNDVFTILQQKPCI